MTIHFLVKISQENSCNNINTLLRKVIKASSESVNIYIYLKLVIHASCLWPEKKYR